MKTRLLIIFTLFLFPLMLPQSYACECFGTKDYTPIVDDSELVFIGTVNDIVVNEEQHSTVFVTFDVHSIAKGELAEKQVTTSTPSSDCSVDYKIGTTYVVVICEIEFPSTDRCSTKPLEIMAYYEVIPSSLLSAMAEPEVPDLKNSDKPTPNEKFTDEQICGIGDVLVDGICLTPEPKQDYSNIVDGSECGLGTAYQDGICIVNQTEENTTESSYKWGGFGEEIPFRGLDCNVDQIYNKETHTCDVRLNSTDVLIPVLVFVLILGLAVILFWRKRK